MISIKHGLALISTAAALTVPWAVQTPDTHDGASATDGATYTSKQKEFYLTDKEKSFIRPGLNVDVEEVTINADNSVEVVVSFTDELGMPLDRAGIITPGAVSMSFILASYDGAAREYKAYTVRDQTSPITGVTETQASSDSGGSWEDIEMGRARYTFGTHLPADYDASMTHSVAIYASRNLQEWLEKTYYANPVYDFRPDGGEVTEVWAAVDDATCNSCHHDLGLHGGSRKSIKLCATCHNPSTVDPDTGNTVDLKVMIHKIHRGANLPSVQAGTPYQIIGFRQSVHDYSEVMLPQDIRNCDNCHRPDAIEGDIWMTRPTRAACGSCHDDVNFETGENHPLPQLDDSACALCHVPEGQREFDVSIKGAHTIPAKSSQLAGLNTEIISVDDAAPGGFPTITFRITNDDGSVVDPASLDRLNILVGGPTTDYAEYFSESATDATFSGDTAMKTLTTALPDDASGSWSFSADVYRFVTIDDGSAAGAEVREAAFNPVYSVELSSAKAVEERRMVVSIDKCNVCHDRLALHGGQRLNTQECIICHNANESDAEVRPEEELPAESVHFKWLIHRIHTGHELANDFTVYGFRGSVHNYNHVGYPGDRRFCEACHEADTYSVPLPEGALETPTERDYYSPMKPAAAACLACHSSVDAASHAYTNTAPFGESCAACHGDDRDFSVERSHAR